MKPSQSFRFALIGSLAALSLSQFSGCATTRLAPSRPVPGIRWPEEFAPERAAFFVQNEIEISAPPQVVWDILVQAEDWPNWYAGAENVVVRSPSGGRLEAGGSFTWKTMGLNFTSNIREFAPPSRVSWESRKRVIRGYHAWLIIPTRNGCRVITDESFRGFLGVMQRIFIPNKLHGLHEDFLTGLKQKAEARVRR